MNIMFIKILFMQMRFLSYYRFQDLICFDFLVQEYWKENAFLGDRNHIHHLLNRKFSLFTSNFILILLVTIPILAMEFTTINRLLLILINLFIYSTIIIFFKKMTINVVIGKRSTISHALKKKNSKYYSIVI